jgi:flagellin
MSMSVNTNIGAMVALQNLNRTNKGLETTQLRVTTGLKVNGPKDDAATYAIAQRMRGEVAGMNAVKSALSSGEAAVDVALNAGMAVSDLLIEMKAKIVQANQGGLDSASRTALQNDFSALRDQVDTIVDSAEFNGTNMIKSATVSSSTNTGLTPPDNAWVNTGVAVQAGDLMDFTAPGSVTVAPGLTSDANGNLTPENDADAYLVGATVGDEQPAFSVVGWVGTGTPVISETFFIGDASSEIAAGAGTLHLLYNDGFPSDNSGSFSVSANVSNVPDHSILSGVDGSSITVEGLHISAASLGLDTMDLTTPKGLDRANVEMEKAINMMSDALGTLGSAAKRIETQMDFFTKMVDIFSAGIGNIVDADLAEESANLQSLQIKQQLGVQALSIANSGPQSILSLFG